MEKSTKIIIIIMVLFFMCLTIAFIFLLNKVNCYRDIAIDFCSERDWIGKAILNFPNSGGYYIECYENERSINPIREYKFLKEEKARC